ncbi:hypothetical protein V3481_004010 [Fusarium oxysporum f. sp. vasinfectum]|uniref:Uncharacterized protein n=1 Tax=Fusarium oxysporum f. sp. vasinfectum 25433 TaxID=1089449 RepID=X0L8J4_FUSOX|nr:hypothetical protein FOTG_14464 [Fusarium oxysporum f. sp. vasinfectum 25433]KAK2697420.1 hypothetical protein QWA68_003538 [Fusarium oxysporum]
MDQLMALLIELPPEARLRKVGHPSEADLTDASAYPSCLVPEAIPLCIPLQDLHAQPIWGHTFCIELCRLISHPVFEMEGTNNLTLILQYAVICRTDDRRPWKMPPIPDVDPLKQLRGVMELCSGPVSTPISEIFANHCTNESPPRCIKARDLTADDPLYREQQDGIKTYLTDPKHLIFVMLQLAKVVQDSPKTEGPYITKERSFEVYSVTTLDLQNIRKALDTMELHCGEGNESGLFELPTDIIFPRYVAKTGVENDAPRDSEELSDLIVAGSMKREREIFDTILGRNRQ